MMLPLALALPCPLEEAAQRLSREAADALADHAAELGGRLLAHVGHLALRQRVFHRLRRVLAVLLVLLVEGVTAEGEKRKKGRVSESSEWAG